VKARIGVVVAQLAKQIIKAIARTAVTVSPVA